MPIHREVNQPHRTVSIDGKPGDMEMKDSQLVQWTDHLGSASGIVETLPHGVQNGSILHYSEEFIRRRHVVSN